MQTGDTNFIYKNKLNKACFQHDMAYGKTKDLTKRTHSDKILKDKAFKIASNPKMMVIKEDCLQWFTSFLTKTLVEVILLMNQIINWPINL